MLFNAQVKGILLMVASAAAMATAGVFVRNLSRIPVAEIVFLRFFIALLVVSVIVKAKGLKLQTSCKKDTLIMGLSGAITVIFYFKAILLVGVSLAALLLYTAPFFCSHSEHPAG